MEEIFIIYPARCFLIWGSIIWVKATRIQGDYGTGREAAKRARVGQLSPYYRSGQMYHNKATSSVLEQILLSYPFPNEWDVADALGHFPQVLEEATGLGIEVRDGCSIVDIGKSPAEFP